MIAPKCSHANYKKSGKTAAGTQRYKCKDCGVRFSDDTPDKPLGKMLLGLDKAELILGMLLEGMSIRAASRLTSVDKDTICRLIIVAGERCKQFMDSRIVNVPVDRLEIDEIWSKLYCSARVQKLRDLPEEFGDSYTFIGITDKKLVVAFHVGKRDADDTNLFLSKVRRAVDQDHRIKVSTDGWQSYKYGVPFALGSNIDFGMLVKKYETQQVETRYSPARIISAERKPVFGAPQYRDICTSHIESMNQKIRMHLRRFTRLTNAHSKSPAHHVAMQNIFFAWFNFSRVHMSLQKKTPAMAHGLADRPLKLVELLG